MSNFLDELNQITQAVSNTDDSQLTTTEQEAAITDTPIQNPENPENWFTTAAESQDYKALNQEIELDRNVTKIYVAVGSGLATLGANACLGNAVLETTYNPVGYMTFSGVIAVSIISAGLSGSRLNGRTFYSSPWLLSSVGASAGVVGGAYAASRPYFEDKSTASKAYETIGNQIKDIEVKPQQKASGFDFMSALIAIGVVIGIGYLITRK